MKKLALSFGFTLALASILLFTCQSLQARPYKRSASYPVQFPIERSVTTLTALEGEIRPAKYTQLIAEHSAKIDHIFVNDGEYVEKGKPLFRFDDALPTLAVQTAEREYHQANRNLIELARTAQDDDPKLNRAEKSLDKARSHLIKTQKALASTTVYAPFSGKVGQIRFDAGNFVKEGESISDLVATDTVEVHFTASPDVLDIFRQTLNSKPDTLYTSLITKNGQYIDGRLSYIDPSLSHDNTKLAAYAIFDNCTGKHLIGSKTTLYLNSPTPQSQLFVPETAVHMKDDIATLFILDDKNTVQAQTINIATVKDTYAGYIPVADGIKATDFVLTAPEAPELVGKKIDPMVDLVYQLNEILNRNSQ